MGQRVDGEKLKKEKNLTDAAPALQDCRNCDV
jgi:hypothetical protein